MIILSETTDNLIAVCNTAPDSLDMDCVVSWRDRTSTTFIAGRTASQTNGTTQVVITDAPAASTQRIVDFISVHNRDTTAHLITISLDDNGTEYVLYKTVLDAGGTLTYTEGRGWEVFNTYQPIKSFTVHGDAGVNFVMTNATLAERFAGNATRHSFTVDLLGYTQVRLRVNKQVASASVNTPLFRAKYYNTYNTVVTNFLQLGQSSQVEASLSAIGYFDSGWVNLAIGARANGVCIAFTELGGDAVADPALGATDILFR